MNKLSYKETKWVDGKTVVDAGRLNHIETAIKDLYNNALGTDDLEEGDGIIIEDNTISVSDEVMTSNTIEGVEFVVGEPESGYLAKKLYLVLKEDRTLDKIVLGGTVIFQN